MLKKILKKIPNVIYIGVLLVAVHLWGGLIGYRYGHAAASAYEFGRLRTTCERQRVMQDLSFYTGSIDGTRGPLTITAEERYFRWYGHCVAAGKRVDPNIVFWEEDLAKGAN